MSTPMIRLPLVSLSAISPAFLVSTFCLAQGGGAVPFNTQFLHDDDDDNNAFDLGFDDPFPTMDDLASAAVAREERETNMEEQDLIAATQGQTRRAQAPPVRFAKKAKRVDVRRLKENIWKGLEIIVDESGVAKEHDDEDEDMVSLVSGALVSSATAYILFVGATTN